MPVRWALICGIFSIVFASDEQKMQWGKSEPSPYNNFQLYKDGLLYAVSNAESNQIRAINTVGNNVYPDGFMVNEL